MSIAASATQEVTSVDNADERRRQIERNQAAIRLLRSWVNVDDDEAAEQRETLAFLMQALNEDRLSDRNRF